MATKNTKQMISLLNETNYAEGTINFIGAKVYNVNGVYCWNGDESAPLTLDIKTVEEQWNIKPIKVEFQKAYNQFLLGKKVRVKDYIFDINESNMLKTIAENFKEIEWEILD